MPKGRRPGQVMIERAKGKRKVGRHVEHVAKRAKGMKKVGRKRKVIGGGTKKGAGLLQSGRKE